MPNKPMNTLICTTPGQFMYQSTERPVPAPGQALVRIRRIGVCGTDLHAFEGTQPFFTYPRILGHELSGELVEANGPTDIRPGEAVTIMPYFYCGHCIACRAGKTNCCVSLEVCGIHIDGGMTDYLAVPIFALLPGNGLSYDELALVEPLAIGAHGVRRAGIQPGEFVLVVGAGPIGLGVMAFARLAGATVIALDINDDRLAFCQQHLGIAHTINARTDDVTGQLQTLTGGDMPTVVIDATGSLAAIQTSFSYLAHGGRYVLVGLQRGTISISHPEFHKRELTLMSSRNATRADFDQVMSTMKNGLIDAATFITHRVSFDQVADQFPGWSDPANGVIKAMVSLS